MKEIKLDPERLARAIEETETVAEIFEAAETETKLERLERLGKTSKSYRLTYLAQLHRYELSYAYDKYIDGSAKYPDPSVLVDTELLEEEIAELKQKLNELNEFKQLVKPQTEGDK